MSLDETQCACYDALVSHRTSEPKDVNVELLRALSLWDGLDALFGVFWWRNYVHLCLPRYEKFVWEFFSSFKIDEQREHSYIRFRLGT